MPTMLLSGKCGDRKYYRLRRRELLMQQSVSGVVASRANKDVLSDKQRKEVEKLRTTLAKGESPYAPFTDKTKREEGKTYSAGESRKGQRVLREPTKVELEALEKKWQSGNEQPDDLLAPRYWFKPDDPFLAEIGLTPSKVPAQKPELPPGKFYCSFCSTVVDDSRATRGRGPLRQVRKLDPVYQDGRIVGFDEKITFRSDKLVACPNCCLQIKPSVDKNGNLTKNNVEIQSYE